MKSAAAVNLLGAWILTVLLFTAKSFTALDITWLEAAAPALIVNGFMFVVTTVRWLYRRILVAMSMELPNESN